MDLEVTSVSRQPEKLTEAASAIQVITADAIRRSGAVTIPDALRLADNLAVAQKNPHSWAISARGFNTELSNKLLVLMDGRTVYTPLFSGVFWDVQDYLLADLEQIEVISGPGGALWGSNAVNGVINITSSPAKATQGFYAETGAGNELQTVAGARYGGQIAPGIYYRIYGKFLAYDRGVLASGASAANDWDMQRGGFRLDAETSAHTTLTFQGDIYGGNESLVSGGIVEVNGGNLLGRWTHSISNDREMRLQVYYDRTHLRDPIAPMASAPAGILVDDLDTQDVDFQYRFAIGNSHSIVWGLNYRHTQDLVENAPGLAFFPQSLDHDLFSGFVQDEIKIHPRVSLTFGSKLEHNEYTDWEIEPTFRVQWLPAPEQTVWAAVSRAVRIPSRIDRDFFQPRTPPYVLAGNNSYRSETVIAYEAGYRARVGARFTGALSLFYNRYDDIRSVSMTPTTIVPLYFDNNLQGENHGFEATADYKLFDHWRLHAGYNLLRENIRLKPGKFDLNNALNETADPSTQLSLRSAFDLGHVVEFDLSLRHVDRLRLNNNRVPATVPAYTELDLRLGWHPSPGLELSVNGQNLLHARHAEYGVPGPNQEQIARSWYAKISWSY